MMERTNRKPGLYEKQIEAARIRRAKALNRQMADPSAAYHAHKDFTKVPVGYVHAELATARLEHWEWSGNKFSTILQGNRQRFTERGDFTNCFRRGI